MNELLVNKNSDKNRKVVGRFRSWTAERLGALPPKFLEANARHRIAESASKDLEFGGEIDQKDYSEHFDVILAKLKECEFKDDGVLKSENRIDSITGKPFFARLRKEEKFYIAEEIGEEGKIISQAKIAKDGQTQLTLHFTDERYLESDANPGLSRDTNFPRATLSTFELLTDTFEKTGTK